MNEKVVKLLIYMAVALALMGVGAAGAWMWQANSYEKQLATQSANYQADLLRITNAGNAQTTKALEQQQAAEQRVATLDAQHTKEKTDALAENDKLRLAVANGTRRLRIAGTCTANGNSSGGLPQASTGAGVGDAATVELSGAAGQAVLDLRAQLIAERKALIVLQEHARSINEQ